MSANLVGGKIYSPSRIPPRLGLVVFSRCYTYVYADRSKAEHVEPSEAFHVEKSEALSRMAVAAGTIAGVFLLALILLITFVSFGWLEVVWPWENLVEEETTIEIDIEDVGPAQIIEITPIELDCRARIEAEVPVVGTQRTSVAGATVSTDTIRLRAIGDVDTCVAADGVEINERTDGTIGIVIDADAIEFVRPRVDAAATQDSVTTDRGVIGQLVEILPFTNEDDELTPAAFAFAQMVIGGSDCMSAAFDQTSIAIEDAYRQQVIDQGANPDDIDVIIAGTPDFGQNDDDQAELGEFEFLEESGTSCVVVSP